MEKLFFQMTSKQAALPRNVDIYGDIYNKLFIQIDLEKRRFHRYVNIFGYMGKNRFLKEN